MKKRNGIINRLWEELVRRFMFSMLIGMSKLKNPMHIIICMESLLPSMQLFACIGELFEEPDLAGVVLSSRAREDMVSVWNRDNQAKPDVRQKIGCVLDLITGSSISEY